MPGHPLAAAIAFRRRQGAVEPLQQLLQRSAAAAEGGVAERQFRVGEARRPRREARRELRKPPPELRQKRPRKRRKRPVVRNVEARRLATLHPVADMSAFVRSVHRGALLPRIFQIRHRVRMPMPVFPFVIRHDPRSLPDASESAPAPGFTGRCRAHPAER